MGRKKPRKDNQDAEYCTVYSKNRKMRTAETKVYERAPLTEITNERDSWYVCFDPKAKKKGVVERTQQVKTGYGLALIVNLDYDKNGKLYGIEIVR